MEINGIKKDIDDGELPIKAIAADLYALCWQSGEVVTYTPDPEKVTIWLNNYSGTCVQEYVKLERLQEDLAHEVLSLNNKLRNASAKIKGLHKALARATGDVEAYKLVCKSGHGPEQSGCDHDWYRNCLGSYDEVCVKCGMKR
ncbi:hypothetical protein STP03_049 [Salmonella phage STP03]|uniref:Uncharacterized protein n=1 Tax=Salmonella phage STP03 TaxID=1914788 RepID=A0A1U9HYR1_9CAUD|nr:hypothetical protein QA065_gp47 [Salmonella phage STP03]APM00303.1 hypothetical protein STP03_049 [Salmonella phage STP03]